MVSTPLLAVVVHRAPILLIVSTMALLCSCARGSAPTSQPVREGAFAVVELFTSEGCSSCPPADERLANIAADAEKRNIQVFPMSFHVDYWDNLGWKDSFSAPFATARQQMYARGLGSQLYTPQMVVNGRTEFVGSDRQTADRAIASALSLPSKTRLSLEIIPAAGGSFQIRFAVTDLPPNCVLNLAVVQPSALTRVQRGENAGRMLSHVNVVRAWKSLPIHENTGEAQITLPDDPAASSSVIIGYVQDRDTLQILAAAKAK